MINIGRQIAVSTAQTSFYEYRPNSLRKTKIPVVDHSTTGKDKKIVIMY